MFLWRRSSSILSATAEENEAGLSSCPGRCGPEARCQLSELKMAATDTSCWHLIKDVPLDGKSSGAKELPTRGAKEEGMRSYCTITPLRRGCWTINKNTFISLQPWPDFRICTRLLTKNLQWYQRNWTRPIWNEENFPNFLKHREEAVKTINESVTLPPSPRFESE